jgi:hypothetical protein
LLAPPADLAETDLRAALARAWGVEVASLRYLPLGFGSDHWELVDNLRWAVVRSTSTTRPPHTATR